MNIYLTEIEAIDPKDGQIKKWCGPEIKAITLEEAEKYRSNNGLGYCKIVGELVMEIGCKPNSYNPDFDNIEDHENYKLN